MTTTPTFKTSKSVWNLSDRVEHLGVRIEQDDSTIAAFLPRGKVFEVNSKAFLITRYTNTAGQSWLYWAIYTLEGDIRLGIRDADEQELQEYDHSNGAD
jgi:hypothetical protein